MYSVTLNLGTTSDWLCYQLDYSVLVSRDYSVLVSRDYSVLVSDVFCDDACLAEFLSPCRSLSIPTLCTVRK